MLGAAVGYGRTASAVPHCSATGPNVTCSAGVFTDPEIIDNTGDSTQSLAVSVTAPFFRVNTTTGNAMTITGYGAVSFIDSYAASYLDASGFAQGTALSITSSGDTTGTTVTPGSVTVETSGPLIGDTSISPTYPYYGFGIRALNYGGGSLSITTNGDVTGGAAIGARNEGTSLAVTTGVGTTVAGTYFGIVVDNDGTGPLTITTNGEVTANNSSGCTGPIPCSYGIRASNGGSPYAVTSATVTTNAATTGDDVGIRVSNVSSGALTITANDDVTGVDRYGIRAQGFIGSSINVNSAAGTTVTGGAIGIFASNFGNGATTIVANGDVAGGTGPSPYLATYGTGIAALNYGTGSVNIRANGAVSGAYGIGASNDGTSLTVTTGAGSTVTGTYIGIIVDHDGTGPLTITANGPVTGNNLAGCPSTDPCRYGIRASNGGGTVRITTNAVTKGGDTGIRVNNTGNGPLTIRSNDNVIGINNYGIRTFTAFGTPVNVITAPGTTVRGGTNGIRIRRVETGTTMIVANGDVTGATASGIDVLAYTGAGSTAITAAGAVTSNGAAADAFAVKTAGTSTTLTLSGTLNGGGGGAVQFDQSTAFADVLQLQPGFEINGRVLAGPGIDTLAFGGSGNGAFNLSKIDTGAATKQFQSFETFRLESGAWSFNGTTTAAFTQTGGTLGGNPTFGGLNVLGGTLAPGNSIGTVTVNGAFSMAAASTFEVEVDAAGNNDKVVVHGTVNLTGATLKVLAAGGNYKDSTDYTIIANDGTDSVKGTFGSVFTNLAFLIPTVDYTGGTGNDVVLNLERNATLFQDVAKTKNQKAVAGALDQFPTDNPLFLAVLNQTASGARQAFDALSGEIHATVAGTLVDDSRYAREAVLGRMMQAGHQGGALGSGGPQVASRGATYDASAMRLGSKFIGEEMAAEPATQPLAFWTQGYGAWGTFDGDGNAATTDRNLGGFLSGMDASVGGSWRVGVATGASFSDVSVDQRYSGANTTTYHLGGYVNGAVSGFALRGGGLWAWSDIETSRAVVFPGFFERQKADYDADTGQLFGEIAYPTQIGGVELEPFAGLAYVSVETSGFKEKGGPQASLSTTGVNQDVGYTTVGLRAAHTMTWGAMQVTPHVEAAWLHAFDDITPGASLAFATTGIGFSIDGVPLAEDSALLDAGVDFALSDRLSAGVSYQGQYADSLEDNAVKGRLTWLFN
ncbi:hypothetical protein GL4_1686 [Methyloceanibacter caenitepidi]|uniref:Autotransporter domain-containing protein n=2 Tax=Methyloceanibacter caenitepidi TaxID=1384459 RepID=A0A0A8K2J6_9HYPH|nr:hypothetical protein GL4_1686 [Methyloceanibacter caenitepidi]